MTRLSDEERARDAEQRLRGFKVEFGSMVAAYEDVIDQVESDVRAHAPAGTHGAVLEEASTENDAAGVILDFTFRLFGLTYVRMLLRLRYKASAVLAGHPFVSLISHEVRLYREGP